MKIDPLFENQKNNNNNNEIKQKKAFYLQQSNGTIPEEENYEQIAENFFKEISEPITPKLQTFSNNNRTSTVSFQNSIKNLGTNRENNTQIKNEKIVTSDTYNTYINSIKTTDKNIDLIQPKAESNIELEKKNYNSKYNQNVVNSKGSIEENNSEIKKVPNTSGNNTKSIINIKNRRKMDY